MLPAAQKPELSLSTITVYCPVVDEQPVMTMTQNRRFERVTPVREPVYANTVPGE